MSSGGTPRKFSEKIAIMERKQNEDVSTFEDIMREVRSITSTDPVPMPQQQMQMPQQQGLIPPQWNQLGGSLPNVHQLPSYQLQDNWPQWDQPRTAHRSRSPEQHQQQHMHYHPYGRSHPSPDRVPPLHTHYAQYQQQHTLHPPEYWNQINRARSDPMIHHAHHQQQMQMSMMPPQHGGPPGGYMPPMPHEGPGMMMMNPAEMRHNGTGGPMPPGQMNGGPMHQSPLQSPMGHMPMNYGFNNGSPMQSPLGSPMGSSMMLDDRTTPMMELSPPGPPDCEAGSLPNLQHMNNVPSCYHATVGQRHSTGACGPRLAPGPILAPESQSAPTSPGNTMDTLQPNMWPNQRTFSNSPESMDIPQVVLTNPDGARGQHLECFNDLQHLTLETSDMHIMYNGAGQDPALAEKQQPATCR